MEDWGKLHYTSHGKREGRTGVPGESSRSSSASTSSRSPAPTKKTPSSYVDQSPDLANAWKMIEARLAGKPVSGSDAFGLTPSQQADYWIKRGATSKDAFGQAHAKEDMQLKTGTYRGSHPGGSRL